MSRRNCRAPRGAVQIPAETMAWMVMGAEVGLAMGVDKANYGPAARECWAALESAAPDVAQRARFALAKNLASIERVRAAARATEAAIAALTGGA